MEPVIIHIYLFESGVALWVFPVLGFYLLVKLAIRFVEALPG